jgi:DNA repair exonuclease SbcCD nuclease subunit
MKIACITDQHFGARNDSIHFSDYFRKFYDNIFFPYLKENNISTVIDLGDTFDHRKYINYNILNLTKDMWFSKLSENDISLHCIVGNHSTYFKNTNLINSIDLLTDLYDNVTSYSEIQEINIGGLDMIFVPWINPQNSESALKTIAQTKCKIGFGHLEINGFYLNSQIIARSGLSPSIFSKFEAMYSGHFHKKSDNSTIYYLGTPYQINWSDYGEVKGFHIFDTETLEMEFIANPYTILEKIYYDDSKVDYEAIDVTQYDSKIIKLVIINKKDLYKFDRFLSKLYNDINVIDLKIIESNELDSKIIEEVDVSDDTASLIGKYIQSIEISGIENDNLSNRMHELYVEASNIE